MSGFGQAGWLLPELPGKPQWFTGDAFGPEASVFAVLADGAAVGLMWQWKGNANVRSMGDRVRARVCPWNRKPCPQQPEVSPTRAADGAAVALTRGSPAPGGPR